MMSPEDFQARVDRDAANIHQLVGQNGGNATYDNVGGYFTEGSFHRARLGFITAVFAPLGALAGWNARKRGFSKFEAAMHGAYCAMRWKVWAFTTFVWLASTLMWLWWAGVQSQPVQLQDNVSFASWGRGQNNSFTTLLVLVNLLTFLPAVLVTYCQNIDESMFKRRFVYRLLRPFHKIIGRTPWMILHTVVLLPFFVMAIKYNT